jgi:hypothetical protein
MATIHYRQTRAITLLKVFYQDEKRLYVRGEALIGSPV